MKIVSSFKFQISSFLKGFLLSTCYLLLVTVVSAVDEVSRIKEAYKNIADIKGSFIQKSYIRDLKRTDIFKGVFWIKLPSKMKWEYRGDKPQEIIINNDKIIIYNKSERQAYRGVFSRQNYGQTPVALLSGFGNIQEEFDVNTRDGRLVLIPRSMSSITSIEVVTADTGFPIKSFTIKDTHSNRIEIILNDIEMNKGIKDSIFDFFCLRE